MADANFTINPQLTAIAVGYKNPDAALIADKVLPRVPTAETFKWTEYDTSQAYTVPATEVGRRSEPNTVTFGSQDHTDTVVDYGLDDPIPQRDIDAFRDMPKPATGGPVDPMQLSTMMLSGLIDLAREKRAADLVFNSSNYASGKTKTLSGTSQWSDYSNSDPLSDLLGALDKPLVRPDTLTIGQDVWTALRQHPKIVQAIYKTAQGAGTVSKQMLADILEIRQVLVGAGWVNTARKGQTPSMGRVWGKNAALTYSSGGAAQLFQPVWGWTAAWGGKFAGTIPEAKKGLRGSTTVRVGEQVKELVAAKDAGYYFASVIA
ncbi:MAG TPA: hypothetical protein VFJ01_05585 [Oleiagrimonas sp.]|nr:hypothetical protein [Oleiagrimonas sp.]